MGSDGSGLQRIPRAGTRDYLEKSHPRSLRTPGVIGQPSIPIAPCRESLSMSHAWAINGPLRTASDGHQESAMSAPG